MPRQDERERIRRRMSALTCRVGASRTGIAGAAEAAQPLGGRRAQLASALPAVPRMSGGLGESAHDRSRNGSAGPGRWDLGELPSDDEADDGEVRSPGWLAEPVTTGWRDRLVPERFRGMRLDPGRRGMCTLLLVGVVAMAIAAVVIFRERPVARPVPPVPAVRTTTDPAVARLSGAVPRSPSAAPGAAPAPAEPGSAGTELVVSVVGLVQRTGLVRLPAGSRVADALAAAGGARDGADLAGLNLAQRLLDGDQVLVGPPGPNPGPPQLGSATINSGARPSAAPSGSAQPSTPSGRVDLNTATESELDALPGIGPVTAKAIVTWRTTHGRFTDVAQLGQVDGIGPARLSRLRELVKV
ncbi:ComEA family DNA-binding protein [Nocardia sp. CS682]|uniref:ComEA family DNA-binding protein n=1 Tax=Nocardia sp. CS682 TaxID=1047172 RepID=UPI001074CCBA|nr:helix-hairpin-helix domain-containing protein [Nocardia sp. CS682]QBS43716.1 competence protein ComEA [Nocardia sp. CS682]